MTTTVAIAGLGTIGTAVAHRLLAGDVPDMRLAAVACRDVPAAARRLGAAAAQIRFAAFDELAELADLTIECAPAAFLPEIAKPVLTRGKTLMVLSVGALLAQPELVALAKRSGGRIIVPTGALLGLDAVVAAAEGNIAAVRMITRKPVAGLLGAPYLVERGIDISGLMAPVRVFAGTAREAAAGFPANLNVAAALSLAGIGPDLTMVEIWADPALTRNTHRIIVDADSARLDMTIENVPSENPRTGRITALSVLAALRRIGAPLRIGT